MQDHVMSWKNHPFKCDSSKQKAQEESDDVSQFIKKLDRTYPSPISESEYDSLFGELEKHYPSPISESEYDLLFEELECQYPETKDANETKNYLFADDCKIYNQYLKKLTRYALKHKYVSGIDYKPKYQVKDEAHDLASNFLTEAVRKNKFAGYCEEGVKIGNVYIMFSQWMSRLRQYFGKQVDMREDKRNKTLRDTEKGDDPYISSTPHAYGLNEVEEGVFEKEIYSPNQLTQEQELSLKMLIEQLEEIVRVSCEGEPRKYEIWSDLLESFIDEKLYNIKKYSDTEWSEVLNIPLKDVRKHKAAMRKALRNNVVQ